MSQVEFKLMQCTSVQCEIYTARFLTTYKVTTLQTEKNPRLFSTKLRAIRRTNAYLLIQIICEHHV